MSCSLLRTGVVQVESSVNPHILHNLGAGSCLPIQSGSQCRRCGKQGSQSQSTWTPAEAWAQRSALLDLPPPADAYAGRRIPVNSDLRSAFLKLSRRLQKNSVFREWKSALRHEKRGIKRSRLRSERWRRRFADEVRKKVQLVSTIRRRA
ncbi:hypothetical protein F5J12DRAFT_736739 [Pisolithus orientalis]|uniref:uncharacterized protein n=1 Tax=Pisolithus orientalis TaxID=936130 RepID=UPI0022240337|nr:uncharacterized protein F5J12DRAFT_736739 [Pisolithus orientalis]KAI6028380.1 hypothetical protein F5J12DRAFT_736739 [Pisolithus orientalis]